MTILEEEVWVGLSGTNIKYFEGLGYAIPRRKDKNRKMVIPSGTQILVKIEDISKGSDILIKFICDYCNGENQIDENDKYKQYDKLLKGRKIISKDCCRNSKCVNKKSQEIQKLKPIKKGNSVAEKHPHLISEWSDINEKTPFEYSYGSAETVWWNCPECNSEYDMKIIKRTYNGCNCPYCAGHRVNHTNCLWTTHSEVAKLLKNPHRGYEITAGSNKKEEFSCLECNYSEYKRVTDIVNQGFSCPRCSDGLSYPEKFIYSMLLQMDVKVERQKIFDWSKSVQSNSIRLRGYKKYDFYISSFNCIIEVHGEQHYTTKFKMSKTSLEEEQENDKIKEKLAIQNNIRHYIVINCSKSDIDFIKNNIIKSELNDLFYLNNINWEHCHKYAISSLVKPICSLWNNFKNINDIYKETGIDKTTIRKYLKQGSEIGFCDYNGQEEAKKTRENNFLKIREIKRVMVIQLKLDGEFIKKWNSIAEAQKVLSINNIVAVCRGRQTTSGGFKWMYKEDYEKIISETIENKEEVFS